MSPKLLETPNASWSIKRLIEHFHDGGDCGIKDDTPVSNLHLEQSRVDDIIETRDERGFKRYEPGKHGTNKFCVYLPFLVREEK